MTDQGLAALDLIERSWPSTRRPEIRVAFTKLRQLLGKAAMTTQTTPPSAQERAGQGYFDLLGLMKGILSSHDLLFLSRHVTYHLVASAALPRVFADLDQVSFAIKGMIEHLVRRSASTSCIDISLKKLTLRGGPGVELSFSSVDRHLTEVNKQAFLTELFQEGDEASGGISLSDCRRVLAGQCSQLWVDFSKSNRTNYHIALPASEQVAAIGHLEHQTFKYDISIVNYADIRKRFGIRKSQSLVTQIEHYVQSLVRYPIDMVMALTEKGLISTIYEAQKGAAQTVASRISQRLGSEKFHIGKRPIDITFSYCLLPLPFLSAKIHSQASLGSRTTANTSSSPTAREHQNP